MTTSVTLDLFQTSNLLSWYNSNYRTKNINMTSIYFLTGQKSFIRSIINPHTLVGQLSNENLPSLFVLCIHTYLYICIYLIYRECMSLCLFPFCLSFYTCKPLRLTLYNPLSNSISMLKRHSDFHTVLNFFYLISSFPDNQRREGS